MIGALLILDAALSFCGSFTTLISTENNVPALSWTTWRMSSEDEATYEGVSQIIGVAVAAAAVVAVVAGVCSLIAPLRPLVRRLTNVASGLAFGVSLSVVMYSMSFALQAVGTEYRYGAGFWLTVSAGLLSCLVLVLGTALSSPPDIGSERWLPAGGAALLLTAITAIAGSFPELYGGEGERGHWGLSAWRAQWASLNGGGTDPKLFGVPLVISGVLALVVGVLLCVGVGARNIRVRAIGAAAAGVSLGSSVTVVLIPLTKLLDDSSALPGPGLWLLGVASLFALVAAIAMLLAARAPRSAAPAQDAFGNWIPGRHL